MVNPFVLEALRAHQLRALYLSSLIQPDLAGNTAYLNPELYTMRLLPPVLPETLFPGGLPPQAVQSPELLGLQGNPAVYVRDGINPVLPINNIGVEQMMAQGYYPAPGRMMPPQVLYDKRSALTKDDILPYAVLPAGALLGGVSRFATLPKGAPMRFARSAAAAGVASLAAHGLYSLFKPNAPLAPDPVRIRNAQLGIDSALTGAGIGGLLGAGLGYAAGGSQSVLPFALTGAGLGGIGGYKYAQHRASVPESIPAKDVPSDIQTAVTKQSCYRYPGLYTLKPRDYADKRAGLFSMLRTGWKAGSKLLGLSKGVVNGEKALARAAQLGKGSTGILGKAKNLFAGGLDRYEREFLLEAMGTGQKTLSKDVMRGLAKSTRGKAEVAKLVEARTANPRSWKFFNSNKVTGPVKPAAKPSILEQTTGGFGEVSNLSAVPFKKAGNGLNTYGGSQWGTPALENNVVDFAAKTSNKVTLPGYRGPFKSTASSRGTYRFVNQGEGRGIRFAGNRTSNAGSTANGDFFMSSARKGAGGWFTHPIQNIKDLGSAWKNAGNIEHGYTKALGRTLGTAAVPYATYASVSKFMEPNHRDNGGYQINHF